MPPMTSAEYADRCRAGMSRLREQAQAATPGTWRVRNLGRHDEAAIVPGTMTTPRIGMPAGPANVSLSGANAMPDATHVATWNPSSVLLVLDGWERQLADHLETLAEHVAESGSVHEGKPCCDWCVEDWPCPDYRRAEAGLADLARDIEQIAGTP